MPQLNPSPWLLIMIFSWSTFLLLAPVKLLPHCYPSMPLMKNKKNLTTTPWNWAWQ